MRKKKQQTLASKTWAKVRAGVFESFKHKIKYILDFTTVVNIINVMQFFLMSQSLQSASFQKDISLLRWMVERNAVTKQSSHAQIASMRAHKFKQSTIARYCVLSVENAGKTNQRLDMDIISHNLHALLTALKKEKKTMANGDEHWSNLRTRGAFHHLASEENRPLILTVLKKWEPFSR